MFHATKGLNRYREQILRYREQVLDKLWLRRPICRYRAGERVRDAPTEHSPNRGAGQRRTAHLADVEPAVKRGADLCVDVSIGGLRDP